MLSTVTIAALVGALHLPGPAPGTSGHQIAPGGPEIVVPVCNPRIETCR